jgi:hypothetical protein
MLQDVKEAVGPIMIYPWNAPPWINQKYILIL